MFVISNQNIGQACITPKVIQVLLNRTILWVGFNFTIFLQGKITNEKAFYSWLNEFLQTSGMSYRRDIRTENGTGILPFVITVIVTYYTISYHINMILQRL